MDMGSSKKDIYVQLGPLNLAIGGNYNYSTGDIQFISGIGRYYISVVDYVLYIFRDYVIPQSASSNVGNGFSLRCLVR